MEFLIIVTTMALGMVSAHNFAAQGDSLPDAPLVTARALARRTDTDIKTLAWFSADNTYSPWEYDPRTSTYTTSGQYFRRCPTTKKCNMYTACSNGVLLAAETTLSCGSGGDKGASRTCGNHVLYTQSGASSALTWYFCDASSVTGVTFYEQNPKETGPVKNSASASATAHGSPHGSADAQRTGSPVATGTVDSGAAESTNSASSPGEGKSNNKAGTIAGSVVGVLGLLAILGGVAFIVLRRRKRKSVDSDVTVVREKFNKIAS